MAAKMKFPPKTPMNEAQRKKILDLVVVSPVVQDMLDREAEDQLARRRELISRHDALLKAHNRAWDDLERRVREARTKREKAEREFRAAIEAEMLLPALGRPSCAEAFQIERELEETASEEIREYQTWVESEFDFTRHLTPSVELLPSPQRGGGNMGFNQAELADISRRMDALRDAVPKLRALKLQAISGGMVLEALHRIHATIPPLRGGDSRRRPLPKFMVLE